MRFAIIEDNKVANLVVSDGPLGPNWVEAGSARIGWHVVDGTLFAPADPPPPPVPRTVTRETFLRLLTQTERIAMRTASRTDVYMEDFMHLLDAAAEVSKDDLDVVRGLAYAAQQGYLAQGRPAEILA